MIEKVTQTSRDTALLAQLRQIYSDAFALERLLGERDRAIEDQKVERDKAQDELRAAVEENANLKRQVGELQAQLQQRRQDRADQPDRLETEVEQTLRTIAPEATATLPKFAIKLGKSAAYT